MVYADRGCLAGEVALSAGGVVAVAVGCTVGIERLVGAVQADLRGQAEEAGTLEFFALRILFTAGNAGAEGDHITAVVSDRTVEFIRLDLDQGLGLGFFH